EGGAGPAFRSPPRARKEARHMELLRYWSARVAQSVFVLWAAFTVSFFVLYGLPSDPVTLMLSQGGTSGVLDPAAVASINHEYGFDQPLIVQYVNRLGAFVTGHFGVSIDQGQDVLTIVSRGAWSTIQIALLSFVLAIV